MANLNKVMLIVRLTRDPEVRMFPNGGKVAKFGFAVNNRKKNTQSGQWEDEPVFLDVEAFTRGEGGPRPLPPSTAQRRPAGPAGDDFDSQEPPMDPPPPGRAEEDIPF